MIAGIDRWHPALGRAAEGYRRWEQRHAGRLRGWSTRRRWAVFVLVPALLIGCGGSIIALPVQWALTQTIEASRGAPSPDAAANEYLMSLSYNDEEGPVNVLDNDHQDELLDQWRRYRDAMRATDPPPAQLDYGALTVGPNQRPTG